MRNALPRRGVRRGYAMLEQSIFDDLEDFFDSIPDVVRAELSLLLVALADDPLVDTKDPHDYDRSARELFDARGRLGRFGNLIYALGAFDVYFAADPRERFGSATPRLENTTTQGDNTGPLRGRYADRLA